ncbi:hypothetical protein B0T26DRAFT_741149 [Lasiosphaeria miniovina]|uniref:Heterokaryon incompatibility domain-containing protein n=1 Tax=Lasiosphaeria miniovina TaxID=1954250 RepID=A0AA40ALL8_9PEZI|nr:uncharacterized protein B0T26DRAFT_741149 [Lasiosphaeria miniovina]KAK0718050.1 hypothetical protein B0T26DRAFT_741149 [Lasiosphaeria miniovina]
MHLLHCAWDRSSSPWTLSISLHVCISSVPPPYAILSHRWAANLEDEVTFDDMMAGAADQKSDRCYAYLEDVRSIPGLLGHAFEWELGSSAWFSRGWTLQELLAPAEVEFFAQGLRPVGRKTNMTQLLSQISRIAERALLFGVDVYQASVAEKISWAANSITTRPEDRAYSLMGLFGVNMPTLYGEGHHAFKRLQHEIMRLTNHQSIFT